MSFFDQTSSRKALNSAAHLPQNSVSVKFLINRAIRNFADRQMAEAEQDCRQILVRDACDGSGLHLLGLIAHHCGYLQAALILIDKAIAILPTAAALHTNRGVTLAALGRSAEAILSYKLALTLEPDHGPAVNNLGDVLRAAGNPQEAVRVCHRSLRLRQDLGETWFNLAVALQYLAKVDQAEPCYRRAIILKPGLASAYHNLSGVCLQLGGAENRQKLTERAIVIEPRETINYLALASTKRFIAGDRHIAEMRALEQQGHGLKPENRVHLHFALAKALGDIGEHEQAFAQTLTANRLKRSLQPYDEQMHLSLFARVQRIFSAEMMAARSKGLQKSDGPLFILGMPRSGSSLVEQILASHADVFGAGEVNLFARSALAILPQDGFPEAAATLSDRDLYRMGQAYMAALRDLAGGKRWMTNKLPENFIFCGLIHLALPSARIIHTTRDPIDICLSCFGHNFTFGQPFSYDLAELGRYYRAYDRLMRHWRAVLPTGVMWDLDYESLVEYFPAQVARLLDFCGLDWDENCLNFHRSTRPVLTASANQVRRPIYRSSLRRQRPSAELLKPLTDALFA